MGDAQLEGELERVGKRPRVGGREDAGLRRGLDPLERRALGQPAAAPAQRASATIGATAATRMSSWPLRSPSSPSTACCVETGRRASGRARGRASASRRRAWSVRPGTGSGSRGVPHSGRRSVSTASASSSLSPSGPPGPRGGGDGGGARQCRPLAGAVHRGSGGVLRPHRRSVAPSRSSQPVGGGAEHTRAPRGRDAGVSSRRAWLPSATQTRPSPGERRVPPPASSSARAVTASTSAERTRATSSALRLEGADRA